MGQLLFICRSLRSPVDLKTPRAGAWQTRGEERQRICSNGKASRFLRGFLRFRAFEGLGFKVKRFRGEGCKGKAVRERMGERSRLMLRCVVMLVGSGSTWGDPGAV